MSVLNGSNISPSDVIQRDAACLDQRAALSAIHHALCQTHGESFAEHFLADYRAVILRAARLRLCGLVEASS